MIDLSTRYLGLSLAGPIVVSASPLSRSLDDVRAMEDAGAAAVVLQSAFEEQFEALDNVAADAYLEHLRRVKAAVGMPVIGSINGVSTGWWIEFAKKIEHAGADALELNIHYLPTDPTLTGARVERMYTDLVRDVKRRVSIPLAVKLDYSFTALANVAHQLDVVGADGLVLFNRSYLPDFDLERFQVVPRMTPSRPYELLVRLHWVAVLFGQVKADLAVTGGVQGSAQVVKAILAGARVVMMTSALLQNGISYLARVRADIVDWMETHGWISIAQMRGRMRYRSVTDPAAFERANFMKVLSAFARRTPPSISPPSG